MAKEKAAAAGGNGVTESHADNKCGGGWRLNSAERAAALKTHLKCSDTFARLLSQRGHDPREINKFLKPRFSDLTDPLNFADMKKAVEIIITHIRARNRIAVFGDYDVDGTTGAFIISETFRWLKIPILTHIPHRFNDGYGLQIPALEKMHGEGIKLVITVDCGIRAFEAIEWAKEHEMDIIVTDHHEPDPERGLPQAAVAVVNPLREDCRSNCRNLSGVAVAFKLAQALLAKSKIEYNIRELLPFVALGMVADMVELTGEARTIVSLGFSEIERCKNIGLKQLCEVCLTDRENLTSMDIGFQLAPRINAAGRMGEPAAVLDLFSARTKEEARRFAVHLDDLNDERKQVLRICSDEAVRQVREIERLEGDLPAFLVIADETFNLGVIGIVAARLVNEFNRPALVFGLDEATGKWKGSGRTVPGFPLLGALEACSSHFIQFGGHAAACGASIEEVDIEPLAADLARHTRHFMQGRDEDHQPESAVFDLKDDEITLELAAELQTLEPFGIGNAAPVFRTEFALSEQPKILKEKHLKFSLSGGKITALCWSGADRKIDWDMVENVRVLHKIGINKWRGKKSLQIIIDDFEM